MMDDVAVWIQLAIGVGTVLVTIISVVLGLRSSLRELRLAIDRLAEADERTVQQMQRVEQELWQQLRDHERRIQDHSTRFARGDEQILQTQRAIQALTESIGRIEQKLDRWILGRDHQ